jgi:hypothetical protein
MERNRKGVIKPHEQGVGFFFALHCIPLLSRTGASASGTICYIDNGGLRFILRILGIVRHLSHHKWNQVE